MMLGIHLRGLSCPKRLMKFLAVISLCTSYSTTTKCLKALASDHHRLLRILARKRQTFFLYDNFNQALKARHQRKNKQDSFMSATSGTLVLGMALGRERAPEESPAVPQLSDLALGSNDTEHFTHIYSCHVVNVLEEYHLKIAPSLNPFRIHPLLPLRINSTIAYEFAAMDIDQASIAGNMRVLEAMRQSIGKSKGSFRRIKMIIAGDHLTISRIISLQALHAEDFTPFDRLKWAIPVLQLFHMQMVLSTLILDTHYGNVSKPGSLAFFIALLGRKRLSLKEKPCYHTADEFLRIVFGAMVRQLFYSHMNEYCTKHPEVDDTEDETFIDLIKHLVRTNIDLPFFGFQDHSTTNANALLFIRDMVVYIEFCDAIKAGDIGRIEAILKRITIMFQAGKNKNYGFELLRLDFNVRHRWTEDRKNAIFSSLLMNTKGLRHRWIPSDLYQEHNNLLIKRTHATVGFKSSAMDYITPLIRVFHKAANIFDEQFELPEVNPYHKVASRETDILDVVRSIQEYGILTQEPHPRQHQCGLMSNVGAVKDLMEEGVAKLVEGGYSRFLQRMEEQSTLEGATLEQDIDLFDDQLLENLDGEIDDAEKYLDTLFN
ncbi:hypothetical protein BGX29_002411 [Mortierella sp. GBA35]|nr:hypothetical protein BGX29_002411 [Mortierella sp. GBA35]